eukprot:scaffold115666_cov69-Phaeocystis_antarctica.AAC.2
MASPRGLDQKAASNLRSPFAGWESGPGTSQFQKIANSHTTQKLRVLPHLNPKVPRTRRAQRRARRGALVRDVTCAPPPPCRPRPPLSTA